MEKARTDIARTKWWSVRFSLVTLLAGTVFVSACIITGLRWMPWQLMRTIETTTNNNRHRITFGAHDSVLAVVNSGAGYSFWKTDDGSKVFERKNNDFIDGCMSVDGTRFASVWKNGMLRMENLQGRTLKETALEVSGAVGAVRPQLVRFSPDGTKISVYLGCTIDDKKQPCYLGMFIYETETLRQTGTINHPKRSCKQVNQFSADGKTIAAVDINGIALYSLADGKEVVFHGFMMRQANGMTGATLTADLKMMAAVENDGTVQVWETLSGRKLHMLTGPVGRVRCCAFSDDGTKLASGGQKGEVFLWNVADGKPLASMQHGKGNCISMALSSTGRLLAVMMDDCRIAIWHRHHGEYPYGVVWTPECLMAISMLLVLCWSVMRDRTVLRVAG